jgi:hypothetical protein
LKFVDVDLASTLFYNQRPIDIATLVSSPFNLLSLTPSSTLLAKRPIHPGITRPAFTLALTQQRPRDQLCTFDPYHHHRRFRSASSSTNSCYHRIKAERFEHHNSQS